MDIIYQIFKAILAGLLFWGLIAAFKMINRRPEIIGRILALVIGLSLSLFFTLLLFYVWFRSSFLEEWGSTGLIIASIMPFIAGPCVLIMIIREVASGRWFQEEKRGEKNKTSSPSPNLLKKQQEGK